MVLIGIGVPTCNGVNWYWQPFLASSTIAPLGVKPFLRTNGGSFLGCEEDENIVTLLMAALLFNYKVSSCGN